MRAEARRLRRMNVGEDSHGCLTVAAPKSRDLSWRSEGVVKAVVREASAAYRDPLTGG
jgi:hypothetical protein